jgi:site-specific DNA recombinase
MAAICYIRVSTKEQAEKQHNLPTQEKKVRDYCTSQKWPVLQLFIDRGESARTEDRPEFQKMLEFCRKNRKKVSHVVVSDLSRFARNVRDQANAMSELLQVGIEVKSVDEPMLDRTASGKLALNMHGAMNQYFSDALSEKTKFRMDAGVKAGRWLWKAPIGYLNNVQTKAVQVDPKRSPLVRKAFELIDSGNYVNTKAALKLVTSLGLRTHKDKVVTPQTWDRMLTNEFYAGWIVSKKNDVRVRGQHEPLISEELFNRVQVKLGRKSTPHRQVVDEFPLRGLVQCSGCGKNLTAGFAKGKMGGKYARYWCWNSQCQRKATAGRDELETRFVALLKMLKPMADILAKLPEIATREWEERKARIAKDAETLSKRRNDQLTMNQKTTRALIEETITKQDADEMKASIKAEIARIDEQIVALDAERSTLADLKEQAKVQALDFVKAWQNADVNKRRELVKALFPQGLPYSNDLGYFEPSNSDLRAYKTNYLTSRLQNLPTRWKKGYFEPGNDELCASNFEGLEDTLNELEADSDIGVPDGI